MKYKINLKQLKIKLKRTLFKTVLILFVAIPILILYMDFCKFPEKYLATWRYNLENEVKEGDPESVDYYNKVYIANGIKLFD